MKYLAIAVLVTAISPAFAAGAGPAFSELAVGESMTVLYHSQGCFHNLGLYFVFERSADGVKASVWNDPASGGRDTEKLKAAGSAVLTDAQLLALDRTLAFYRGKPGDGCTTEDRIHITWKRNGTPDEKYTDGSCSIQTKKDVLTFRALADHIATLHAAKNNAAK